MAAKLLKGPIKGRTHELLHIEYGAKNKVQKSEER